jgi:glycosyltransferase involved in cell wall biosynthesis
MPMIVTDMMMSLTRLLPKQLPTTFGTPEVVDNARAAGRRCVELMLPPVDVQLNAPGAADGSVFRQAHGIADGEVLLVTVCRLSPSMKSEGLVQTMDAVRTLGRDLPIRFVIVGEGIARATLEERANEVNEYVGRPAVLVARGLLDPRPAYAAADIVLGMGGSSLRGMAFGKPVIVVGERGFSAPFTPETAPDFYYKGMYGLGDGNPGNDSLARSIRNLAEDAEKRSALGHFSRNFVVQHFDLHTVSARFAEFCRRTAAARGPQFPIAAADALRTAAVYFRERRFLTPSRAPGPEVPPPVSS